MKSFVFGNKLVEFVKSTIEIDKNIIGSIKYTHQESLNIELVQFKEIINIKHLLADAIPESIFVDLGADSHICLFYINENFLNKNVYKETHLLNSLKLNKNLMCLSRIHLPVNLPIGVKNSFYHDNSMSLFQLVSNNYSKVFKLYKEHILILDQFNRILVLDRNLEMIFSVNRAGKIVFCMNGENIFCLSFQQHTLSIQKRKSDEITIRLIRLFNQNNQINGSAQFSRLLSSKNELDSRLILSRIIIAIIFNQLIQMSRSISRQI